MKLLIVGSTGLVGRHVLALALADSRIKAITAPSRREIGVVAEHLLVPVVDFSNLPADAPWWQADALICTLGTTLRQAGSQAAFRHVDHDLVLEVARLARDAGTPCLALNSAIGADAASSLFYNRVKGEVERDLLTLGYPSVTFARPGLIGGVRDAPRQVEHVMSLALRLLHPVLPRRWRINEARTIAQALLEAALAARAGTQIVSSEQLAD